MSVMRHIRGWIVIFMWRDIKSSFTKNIITFCINYTPEQCNSADPVWKKYFIKTEYKSCKDNNVWFIRYPAIHNRIFDIGNAERKSWDDDDFSDNTFCREEEVYNCHSKDNKKCWEQYNFYKKPESIADYSSHVETKRHRGDKKEDSYQYFWYPEQCPPIFYDNISEKKRPRKIRSNKCHLMNQWVATKAEQCSKDSLIDLVRANQKKQHQRNDIKNQHETVRRTRETIKHNFRE